ncbi:MAG: DUF1844 domain-containing protein [Terracidiphilus sp.]
MSDTPKFEVIDRRKMKAEEEKETHPSPAPEPAAAPAATAAPAGPRLVVHEPRPEPPAAAPEEEDTVEEPNAGLPPAPTAQESREQKAAYEASAERLEDLVRAQNPAAGPQPPIAFEHLVQQLYLSAMIQMGAGAQEGQRPRVDILGARQTIDLMGVLAEKTRGNLTAIESRFLDSAVFEARMAFLELTNMITLQGIKAPPPPQAN